MKRTTFIIFLLVIWLATCKAPEPNMPKPSELPTQTSVADAETAALPTPTETAAPVAPTEAAAASGKLPAPPFPAKLYVSESGGFALDYPDT